MDGIITVKIKIQSEIDNLDPSGLPQGDREQTVSEASGSYSYSDGGATLTYSESGEGGRAYSQITVSNGRVTVRRSGAIESELCFREGETHRSVYSIPPYSFDAEITARRVRVSLDEAGGSIDLLYNMKIGGAEKSARMRIWILQASNQA